MADKMQKLEKKLAGLNHGDRLLLIYNWIKTDTVNFRQYTQLIAYERRLVQNEHKEQSSYKFEEELHA